MDAGTVYRKTELGAAEVRERKLKLNPRVRTMLIMIDGAISDTELIEHGERVGAPADFLDQLVAAGLIEPIESLGRLLGRDTE